MNTRQNKSALVIGASMAGLLTARILSIHFRKVYVVERDEMHVRAEARKGQPQTEHLHALLSGGLHILLDYFPDLMDGLLKECQLNDIAKPYLKRVAKFIDNPWQMAVGEDFRFPQTKGSKPFGIDLVNAYVAQIHRATHTDQVVGRRAFFNVMNMIELPSSLFKPRILWRVMRSIARQQIEKQITPAQLSEELKEV